MNFFTTTLKYVLCINAGIATLASIKLFIKSKLDTSTKLKIASKLFIPFLWLCDGLELLFCSDTITLIDESYINEVQEKEEKTKYERLLKIMTFFELNNGLRSSIVYCKSHNIELYDEDYDVNCKDIIVKILKLVNVLQSDDLIIYNQGKLNSIIEYVEEIMISLADITEMEDFQNIDINQFQEDTMKPVLIKYLKVLEQFYNSINDDNMQYKQENTKFVEDAFKSRLDGLGQILDSIKDDIDNGII